MFKKTKSKVLVDYASEEDDMWHYHHSYKEKDAAEDEEEDAVTTATKEAKVKKLMSKKEKREKKMLSSKDDEHFLLTGVKLADRKGPQKKVKDGEKEKKDKADKGHCFWDSVTMTMRQISPTKKLEKMEGWEPPHVGKLTEAVNDEPLVENRQKGEFAVSLPDSLSIPVEIPSWGGLGFEEDSSRYANLTDSNDSAAAVRWTSRAKVKLAGISRMSRGIVSESAWGGFK
ncbi:testis development-related protein [Austrofundulus limnaeus]|uniref:Testis development-related protein n=1 Tax=Austrofundulus limnaeus TaxID=52670 RepID=A0A2I4BGY2_AUSLI|nr:PREDICTED: testis development-related protein-like [Austrofundulus limnaeus]